MDTWIPHQGPCHTWSHRPGDARSVCTYVKHPTSTTFPVSSPPGHSFWFWAVSHPLLCHTQVGTLANDNSKEKPEHSGSREEELLTRARWWTGVFKQGCHADTREEQTLTLLPAVAPRTRAPPPNPQPLNLPAYQPQGQHPCGPQVFLAPSPMSGKAPRMSTASPTCKESQPGNPAKRLASWQELRGWASVSSEQPPGTVQGPPWPGIRLHSPQPASPGKCQRHPPSPGAWPRERAPPQSLPICTSLATVSPQWWVFRNPRLSTSLVLNGLWVFGENGIWAARRMTSLRASQKASGAQATEGRKPGTSCLAETSCSRLGCCLVTQLCPTL